MTNAAAPIPQRGTRFLWLAAGCPEPVESEGSPLPPRDLRAEAERERRKLGKQIAEAAKAGRDVANLERALAAVEDEPHCASCGAPATNRLDDAISDSFTTVKNASRAWPHGGRHVCRACLWCSKTVALKSSLWFARIADERAGGGVWFVPIRPFPGWPESKPNPLEALLHPPPPPFVAGLPLYGIDHGGEANLERAIWPWIGDSDPDPARAKLVDGGAQRLWVNVDPLIKLQSKHTALYCEVSHSADRYRLQVDDAGDITVDVPLWRSLRVVCEALLLDMRNAGVGATDARESLTSLRPPFGFMVSTAAWRERTAPFRQYTRAAWWGLFTGLLMMPALVKQERPVKAPAEPKPAKPAKAEKPARKGAAKAAAVAAVAPAPVAAVPDAVAEQPATEAPSGDATPAGKKRQQPPTSGQISLF